MSKYFVNVKIKENRRADKITSGPQSQILDGVSWEEAKKLQVLIKQTQKYCIKFDHNFN